MIRMCVDQGQYEPDDYWKSIGVATVEQVRQERLWRAAEEGVPPAHLTQCPACAETYESFVRLRAIVVPAEPVEQVAVACCPDTATLAGFRSGEIEGERGEAIAKHLKECPPCREDLAFLARSQEPREHVLSLRGRTILMAIAAAALVAAIIPWHRGTDASKEAKLDFTPSSRWANLAQMPEVDRAEMMRDSPESHHSRLEQVLDAYEKGQFAKAEEYAGIITTAVEDPSAEYMLAMARYKQNKVTEGYKAMLVSERMAPVTAPRCWATMQYALLMGDRKTVEREARHAEANPGFSPRCRDVLLKLG